MAIRFGTDGWRGVMGRDFTAEAVRRAAAALAYHLEAEGTAGRGCAVAYDRRRDSEKFAAEAAGVLAARGIPVRLASEPYPTPLLSFAVREGGLAAGVMITASHNPPEWNGFKLKGPHGGPAGEAMTAAVEENAARAWEGPPPPPPDVPGLKAEGKIASLDPWPGYAAALGRVVDFELLRRAKLRVAADLMHGSGSPWLERAFAAAGVEVAALRPEADPDFGGVPPEPTPDRLPALLSLVSGGGFSLGVATDGDGDRIAAVDERGRYFSPQRILALFAWYLWKKKGHRGEVAKAVSATSMLDLLGERYGFAVHTVPVGFKHVSRLMGERHIFIGGEESGAIGLGAHLPERDGIMNALLLAEIVAATGKGPRAALEAVFAEVGHFAYERQDLRLDPVRMEAARARAESLSTPATLAGRPVVAELRVDGVKWICSDHSWLLLRLSGTEPLLRIYAEGRDREGARALLAEGRKLLGLT